MKYLTKITDKEAFINLIQDGMVSHSMDEIGKVIDGAKEELLELLGLQAPVKYVNMTVTYTDNTTEVFRLMCADDSANQND